MSKDDGGSAFPREDYQFDRRDGREGQSGMSLRDYFAGQALIAFASVEHYDIHQTAVLSYAQADAMLKARKP